MADFSLVIRNARIVDGTGAPARSGDVGLSGDRIAAVGTVNGRGATEIDAKGLVLAPGFIDIHTHYDPQLCWDRLATPSPEHGVTSLIMGNCSISLAPVKPADRMRVIHLFGSVEDMEGRLLEETVPFSWESFADYLGYLRQGLGPNVGAFLGHSNLRLYVMGKAAQERAATDDEIAAMCKVLREALRAGAFGLSFTYVHYDETGRALPTSFAERREMVALLKVMAEEGRGLAEVAPNLLKGNGFEDFEYWGSLAHETGVTCSLSPLLYGAGTGDMWKKQLARFEYWQSLGAPLFAQTQTRPLDMTIQLSEGSAVLSKTELWRQIFDLPVEGRMKRFSDPALRPTLEQEVEVNVMRNIAAYTIVKRAGPANAAYVGRTLADIAKAEGKTVTATMLDIALKDRLETAFSMEGLIHSDIGVVSQLLHHPGIHIGSADAGAHIAQFAGAGDTCYLFEKFVRQEKLFTLEEAVKRLTSDLAQAWRIKDRGEIAPGKFADLVLFDPDTIERGEEIWVEDVPGGHGRYTRHPKGIAKVFVNGALLVDQGAYTEARPGRII